MIGLRVLENRIVSLDTGTPVLLRGINRSGLEYSREEITPDEIAIIVAGWGANIIRLPFNQEWILTDPAYLVTIDRAVETAAALGAYTLLDLHWLDTNRCQSPLPDEDSAQAWRVLAKRYRGQPAVLYDIFNEPHTPATLAQWQTWAIRIIEVVRSENPLALIFVSGMDWGYDLSGFPLPGVEGVVYSTHVYTNKGCDWDRAFGNLATRHPVHAGEWGGEGQDLAWGRALSAYFKQHEIGWTAWSWRDWPHLVSPPAPPYVPSAFGRLVLDLLLQKGVVSAEGIEPST